MSVATEPRRHARGETAATPCERCGASLAADQEWCLECGAARTLIHRPADWRIAAAIVGTVLLLVLAGFAIALINLSGEANRSAASSSPAATSATTASASRASTTPPARAAKATPSGVSDWPIGLPGWTVVLFTGTSRPTALISARQLTGAGLHVGILNTSQHPSTNMRPGHFAVFTGRYPTRQAAQSQATSLHRRGFRARARLVGVPGSR